VNSKQIQRIVIIVKENHTFDNYFGTFKGAAGMKLSRSPNPPPKDPDHRHAAWLKRKSMAVRTQFIEQDIPAYFSYARQFTLCDHYFTDVAGPSTPNHLMLVAADSPIIDNPPRYRSGGGGLTFNIDSLPAQLDRAHLSWGNYGGYVFDFIKDIAGRNTFTPDQFAKDALAGKLPVVTWLYAPRDASEHPPDPSDRSNHLVGNVTHGMQWTVDQINAVVKGGFWPKVAIFITWDDWGGWFDHIDPPEVDKWSDGTQFRYGSRVPCLVLSPYAKRGHVSSVLHSHVSVVKFCETIFGLPSLNQRTSAASDMMDCFDFTQATGDPPA
jgi:phospholipase C